MLRSTFTYTPQLQYLITRDVEDNLISVPKCKQDGSTVSLSERTISCSAQKAACHSASVVATGSDALNR